MASERTTMEEAVLKKFEYFQRILIKGRTKFEGSKNVPLLILDGLFLFEFAFNYRNISAYLLKK